MTSRIRINSLSTMRIASLGDKFGLVLVAFWLTTLTSQAAPLPSSPKHNGALAQNTELLEALKPLERTLSGGQTQSYELKLTSGQVVRLVADQRGIDVTLRLYDPSGKQLTDVNDKRTERGRESASLISEDAGSYRVEVCSLDPKAPSGRYEVRIDRVGPATEQDRTLVAAERVVAEANKLLAQGTKVSVTQALEKYKAVLTVFELAGDLQMKAVILNRIGRCYISVSEYQKALEYLNQAVPLTRATDDHQLEASTLSDLGQAYRLRSENEKALDYLNQSIQIWQLIQDRRGELGTLNIIARIYYGKGEVYKALVYFDRALDLSRVLSDQGGEMMTLSGMAGAYYVLGENEKASENWKQALAIARLERRKGMEMVFLSKLGSVYNALGNQQEALAYLDQAIELAREQGYLVDEAGALQSKGRVYRSMGEPKKAIDHLEQSLVILKGVNNPPGVARAHYNLGKIYTDLREYEKALDYLNRALPVWRATGDPINIAATIRELARAELGRGNLETALAQSETAISLMEWVRTQAGGPELRASYLALVQDCFELRIDVLTRLQQRDPSKDYAAAALQTSERARARSLLDTLAEAGVDIRQGVARDLLEREQTITEELSAKASERARLVSMNASERLLTDVSKDISELSAQYERVEAEIRAASPGYAELEKARPLSLAEIREQVIDDQTLMLEYYLGQERTYLWAVTSSTIKSYELPKRTVIEKAARQVYELLTARNRRIKFETAEERQARIAKADADYPAAASALSQVVLGPVAGQLKHKRLLIVSDGALQYVPFAALPTPIINGASSNEALAATHELVSLPSASTLAVLRRQVEKHKPAPKTITVIADPVFNGDDQRVKDSVARNKDSTSDTAVAARRSITNSRNEIQRSASESGWDGEALSMMRLPFTRREADAIAALVPAAYRKEQLDFDASLANATNAELAQYRIVHFATHGFLNSRHPELSGIVLSLIDEKGREQNGFLRAHEIYDLRIPAELVVLSGCRTGLGKEIRGEGLIGLTRAFMHAGAARVLVSLWDVNDEATAELMTRFYRHLLGPEKLSPAAALRAAQLSMARDKRWSSPYFWAGFTLQGEPR